MFQKDPEKQAAKEAAAVEQRAAQEAATREKRAAAEEEAFRSSPGGQARTARDAGDAFFQYTGSLAETKRKISAVMGGTATQIGQKKVVTEHTDVLGVIEDEGWRLDDVGYVFEPTGSVSRDKAFSSGQTATVSGRIVGIYLFRAAYDGTLANTPNER